MALVSKNFSDIVTFTRASAALYTNSAGTLTTAAINAPRIDYDPATLAVRGLLIEEQRTNLLLWSQQHDNAAWAKTRATVTADAATAPDGTLTMDKLVEDSTAANSHFIAQLITAADVVHTYSFFAKAGERSRIDAVINGSTNYSAGFDLSAGTVVAGLVVGPTASTGAKIVALGGGIYRCTVSQNAAAGTALQARVYLTDGASATYNGDGTSGAYVWGEQFEAGSFATSYMGETTTAAVTRAADVATINTLAPWFNASEGTIYAEFQSFATAGFPGIYNISDGTNNNRFNMFEDGSNGFLTFRELVSGTQQGIASAGSTRNTVVKIASAYSSTGVELSVGGAAAVTNANTTHATGLNKVALGASADSTTNFMNGWLRKLTYYPQRKPTQPLTA